MTSDHHSAQLQLCMRRFTNQRSNVVGSSLLHGVLLGGVNVWTCVLHRTKASVLREDWATAEQMERAQLQLLNVVDFINKFHASAKTRLAVLSEKMTAIERKLRLVLLDCRGCSDADRSCWRHLDTLRMQCVRREFWQPRTQQSNATALRQT
ncbi:hypothetical protein F443_09868 [Phytophthora nicotianae P1569]|uniref:Uncharacterized protein n=1 Tax=Phytophthora nicotianae P1569 TaxID=1317065 RepID=V9F237_PHYNI|nr:hypothetical protein F443_09868 [Phytophthora nicotianae P1569]